MAKRKRRSFTTEFREQAVRKVRESGKPIATVARELDLTETALRSWVRQAEIDAGRGTSGALTTEERAPDSFVAYLSDRSRPASTCARFLSYLLKGLGITLCSGVRIGWSSAAMTSSTGCLPGLARAIARADLVPRAVQTLTWNAKRPLENVGGKVWLSFRRCLFETPQVWIADRHGPRRRGGFYASGVCLDRLSNC